MIWFVVWMTVFSTILVLFFRWQHQYFCISTFEECDKMDQELEQKIRKRIMEIKRGGVLDHAAEDQND